MSLSVDLVRHLNFALNLLIVLLSDRADARLKLALVCFNLGSHCKMIGDWRVAAEVKIGRIVVLEVMQIASCWPRATDLE